MQDERRSAQKAIAVNKQESLKNKLAMEGNRKQYTGSSSEINSIINELAKNNLVTNDDALSFSLNNKELIVNGKKQPEDIHQSLKEKYIQKPGDLFNYSKKGGSTSITINKE